MGVEKVFGDRGCEEGKMEWKSFGCWDILSLGGCLHMQISKESFSKAKLCNGHLVLWTLTHPSKALNNFYQQHKKTRSHMSI